MDGNGRWARQRGLPRSEGHKAGTDTAKALVTTCREMGISCLTLYTFSKENRARPGEEVRFLFELLSAFLRRELPSLLKQSIRLRLLGEWEALPLLVRRVLRRTCEKTAHCEAMTLNLALNYSGREDIAEACRRIVRQEIDPDAITEETIRDNLSTSGLPDPDLVIRTSGEQRISNYLLFQSAYSEFYFTDTLWPDFDRAEFEKALAEYGRRKRRFGKTEEQVQP